MTLNHGLDCDTDCTSEVGCLKTGGFSFICRYINRARKTETDHISTMGVYVVSVFEADPTSYNYFTPGRGNVDAQVAQHYAESLNQPGETPIYFTVDFDASLTQAQGNISEYFKEIREVLPFHYKVGCYGNGTVLTVLLDAGLIDYAWLSMSRLWSGSVTFDRWNIKQSLGGKVCGIEADYDETNGNGGGWRS